MIRKYLKVFVTLSIITTMLVGCGDTSQTATSNEIGAIDNTQLTGPESTSGDSSILDTENDSKKEVLNATVDTDEDDLIKITTDTGEKVEIDTTLETTEVVKNDDGSTTYTTEDGTEVTVKEDGTATVTPAPSEEPETSENTKKEETSSTETTTQEPTETPTPVHSHDYTSKVTKVATCIQKGVRTYTCSCGESYTEDIAKTNHTSSDWIVTKAATCQSTGIKVKTCTVCNTELETAAIEKSSDHTYVWTHVTNGDYKVNICSGCGIESGNRAYNLGNNIYGYYDAEAAATLFERVNNERNSAHTVIRDEVTLEVIGLTKIPSLIWRDEDIAKKRALDIVSNFSHDGYLTDNENLARGQGSAVEVKSAWYNSSTHRQTMCSIDYAYGSTACLWVDSDGKGTMYPYWTLVLSIE